MKPSPYRLSSLLLPLLTSSALLSLIPSPTAWASGHCRIQHNQTTQTLPNGTPQQYRILSGITTGQIRLENCRHYIIENNHLRDDKWGIYIKNSKDIIVRNNLVENIGQEAIAVKPGSQNIQILHNTIRNTGLHGIEHPHKQNYAEGIYIGDGKNPAPVHRVLIKGNRISGTRAEGIEIKPRVTSVVIEDNYITDSGATHGGAIAVGAYDANPAPDPRHIIRNNVIDRFAAHPDRNKGKHKPYTWVAGGIWVNAGAEIYGNTIRNVHSCGILLSRTLTPHHHVEIHNNSASGDRAPLCQGYGQPIFSEDITLGEYAITARKLAPTAYLISQTAGLKQNNAIYDHDWARLTKKALPLF